MGVNFQPEHTHTHTHTNTRTHTYVRQRGASDGVVVLRDGMGVARDGQRTQQVLAARPARVAMMVGERG